MRARITLPALIGFAIGQIVTLAVVLGPILGQPWLSGFRNYFSSDQFAYAAIATNVSQGNLALVEPFNETGQLFYPSAWYFVLGLFSRVTGLPVHQSWTLLGVLAVAVAVLACGIVAWRASRLWWAPILPALALLTGTFALATSSNWYVILDRHAVLWGPFGTLFTLNAEVIGLCIVTIAMVALIALALRHSTSHRLVALGVIGALIGVTANVQTYSFLTGVSLLAATAAVLGLLSARSWRPAAATALLLVLLYAFGDDLSAIAGHLPMFALLLVALSPSAWLVARQRPKQAAVFAGCLAVAASPQLIRTLLGVAGQDPFLTYRQASTDALSVPAGPGLLAAAIPVTLGLALLLAPRTVRPRWLTALVLGLGLGWVLVASNDRWGFTQEPYRFWLQYFIVSVLLLSVATAITIRAYLTDRADPSSAPRRWIAPGLTGAASLVLFIASLADFTGFWSFARDQGVFDTTSEESTQIAELGGKASGLLAYGPCIDPLRLKLLAKTEVPYFNEGLAWPAESDRVKALIGYQRMGELRLDTMRQAGVDYVITDARCPTQWEFSASDRVIPAGKAGPFTLWQVLAS